MRILRNTGRRFGYRGGGRRKGGFEGNYDNWESASSAALRIGAGYDQPCILDVVEKSTMAVIEGKAAFERDSVLFNYPDYPYPVLACLLKLAAEKRGRLSVLDFGGALGSLYFQCKPFLNRLESLRWNVVEQSHFVMKGNASFQTSELRFFPTITDCLSSERPDVAIFSGVLQYLESPNTCIDEVGATGAALLIDRTPTVSESADAYTIQNVPASIYRATLPFRAFGRESLSRMKPPGYVSTADFDALDGNVMLGGREIRFKGFFLEKSKANELRKH